MQWKFLFTKIYAPKISKINTQKISKMQPKFLKFAEISKVQKYLFTKIFNTQPHF